MCSWDVNYHESTSWRCWRKQNTHKHNILNQNIIKKWKKKKEKLLLQDQWLHDSMDEALHSHKDPRKETLAWTYKLKGKGCGQWCDQCQQCCHCSQKDQRNRADQQDKIFWPDTQLALVFPSGALPHFSSLISKSWVFVWFCHVAALSAIPLQKITFAY